METLVQTTVGTSVSAVFTTDPQKAITPITLAQAVFFYRLGEIHDRSYGQQGYRSQLAA